MKVCLVTDELIVALYIGARALWAVEVLEELSKAGLKFTVCTGNILIFVGKGNNRTVEYLSKRGYKVIVQNKLSESEYELPSAKVHDNQEHF